MSNIAIRAEDISKQYTIQKTQRYKMLREQVTDILQAGYNALTNNELDNDQPTSRKKKIWALNDVSFDVLHGESIGIIGANGAGKTTLLKILSRVTTPTKGRVRLRGRVGSLLEVGTGFHPELTGRENVFLNGAVLGMKKAEIIRKFDEIIDFSGVEEFIDTPVKRYSTGMRMRLAFSVAAHLEPEILLVDEVLAVGDVAFQKKSLNKMESVTKDGRTVLFVSHNLAAIKSFCPKTILLDKGKISYFGESDLAIQKYLAGNATLIAKNDLKVNKQFSGQILNIIPVNSNLQPENNFPHDQPIFVKLKVAVNVSAYKMHIMLKLDNSNLDTIVVTRDFETTGNFLVPTEPGIYDFLVEIPANFLTPGNYYLGGVISAQTGKNRIRSLHKLEHFSEFNVYDNGSQLSQFNIPWQGWVHTKVLWKKL